MSRVCAAAGAASVLASDISPEMIRLAEAQNDPVVASRQDPPTKTWPNLSYQVLDARDPAFRLEKPVDLLAAAYLLHDAGSEAERRTMADLIGRNLKPGGRFVTYTIEPDCDLLRDAALQTEFCGFS